MSAAPPEDLTRKRGRNVAVVGGGLVGSLQALFMAKNGFKVDLYEKRGDIRAMEQAQGRSINLALSTRGREALREVGLEGVVLEHALPMYARMIHSESGALSAQPYGTKDQCIYSVDRLHLNKLILERAGASPDVTLNFHHQLLRADLTSKKLTFRRADGDDNKDTAGINAEKGVEVEVVKDFIFGCDGAFSTVRRQMMRWGRLDYSQEFIEHGYKELTMPATQDGLYAMDNACLHIWPRGEFMMIALPNQDRSFTLTLFMPFEIFQSIDTDEGLLAFFMKHFQDAVPKIGVDRLLLDYFQNPMGNLVSVKCSPHFMADSVLIMGDAAHAVVPFYGQGMNAGFEDCLIFSGHLEGTGGGGDAARYDVTEAASRYAENHHRNCHTIADLSMYNYIEMRSHVTSWSFRFHKRLDNLLHFLLPGFFVPLYSMVAFTRTPYTEVVARHRWQKKVVSWGVFAVKAGVFGCGLLILYRLSGIHAPLKYRIIPCVLKCVVKDFFD